MPDKSIFGKDPPPRTIKELENWIYHQVGTLSDIFSLATHNFKIKTPMHSFVILSQVIGTICFADQESDRDQKTRPRARCEASEEGQGAAKSMQV